ncbi:MAG TPA: thiolase family protein [Mycobacterium sp.]|nr:thiolase family protein [Mycobacterium sp.]
MNRVGIAGVGLTRFTKQPDREAKSLVEEAVELALIDARVGWNDIGAIFCGSAYADRNGNGQVCLRDLPTRGLPIVNVENACASGSCAVHEAYAWVRAGLCDAALAVGMDKTSWVSGMLPMPGGRWYFDLGLMTPGWYGLQASRYMSLHGATEVDLARVVVKSRALACHNPIAHFRSPVTVDEVLHSAMVSTPFTLHQCCPKTDGAGAVLVASEEFIARHRLASVWIAGARMVSGQPVFSDAPAGESPAAVAARLALNQANVDATDLDVVEVHDAFSIGEFLYAEALGLCGTGEYAEYLRSGRAMPNGGGVAVNPSGGLLSRGHPIGATGVAQIAEVVWQLRGLAHGRQIDSACVGATLTMGAIEWERDANVAVCFVLER